MSNITSWGSYNIWSTTGCPCWYTPFVSQAPWTRWQKRSSLFSNLQEIKHHYTGYQFLLSTMLGNHVQLWLYSNKKTSTTTRRCTSNTLIHPRQCRLHCLNFSTDRNSRCCGSSSLGKIITVNAGIQLALCLDLQANMTKLAKHKASTVVCA